MEIYNGDVFGGRLIVYNDGDYIFIEGNPADVDVISTYYRQGTGPERYRVVANRFFELYQQRAASTDLRGLSRRSREDREGVPIHMRSSVSRFRSDSRLSRPSTAADETRLREITRQGILLGNRLGRLHARLNHLIATGTRGFSRDVMGHSVGGAVGLGRVVPTELEIAIISGLVSETSAGVLQISDISRGMRNDIIDSLSENMIGFHEAYINTYVNEQNVIIHELLETVVMAVVDIITTIVEFGAPIIINALRRNLIGARGRIINARRGRVDPEVLTGEVLTAEQAHAESLLNPTIDLRPQPRTPRRLESGSRPLPDVDEAATDLRLGNSTESVARGTTAESRGVETLPRETETRRLPESTVEVTPQPSETTIAQDLTGVPTTLSNGTAIERRLQIAYNSLLERGIDLTDPYTLERMNQIYRRLGRSDITTMLRRAEGGELRTLIRYADMPNVDRVRFVRPSQSSGSRTPDLMVFISGSTQPHYVEIRTITQAPSSQRGSMYRGSGSPAHLNEALIYENSIQTKIMRGQISASNPGVVVFHVPRSVMNGNWLPTWQETFDSILRRVRNFQPGLLRIEVTTGDGGLLVFNSPNWIGVRVQ